LDPNFSKRAKEIKDSIIIGGENYGQGSSREHAAIVCRYLGIKVKIAKSFARIHRSNLINFGVLPLVFKESGDYQKLDKGDKINITNIRDQISGNSAYILIGAGNERIKCLNEFSERERSILLAGGLINLVKQSIQ